MYIFQTNKHTGGHQVYPLMSELDLEFKVTSICTGLRFFIDAPAFQSPTSTCFGDISFTTLVFKPLAQWGDVYTP